jgi:hypothetical protein
MARRRTLPQNIRHYKQEYLRLLAYEARLNHQLFKMKKRIKLLAQEEQLRLTEKALLSEQLQKIHQQKEELESQPACKQRNAQLKRVEKEYKQVKARHSRNQYQLDQLEVKKDKDNAVKLLVKEAKHADVTVRIQSTYETWMYFEQIQQWELAAELAVVSGQIVDNQLVVLPVALCHEGGGTDSHSDFDSIATNTMLASAVSVNQNACNPISSIRSEEVFQITAFTDQRMLIV